jgi:diguanylate cyclase (GGDEF)-like protein
MTIKQKLTFSALTIIAISLLMGFVTFYGYKHVTNEASLSNDFDKEVMHLQMMLRGLNEVLINEGTPDSIQTTEDGLYGFEKIHIQLLTKIQDPETLSILNNKIQPSWYVIKREIFPFLNHYLNLEHDESLIRAGRLIMLTENIIKDVEIVAEKTRAVVNKNSRKSAIIEKVIILIFAIILFSFISLLYHVYRSIAHPIEDLTTIAEGFHKGNLNIMMDESRKDEFGLLAEYFNTSTKKLKDHEEKLKQLAYYDQLTNLPNRVNFLSYLERMLKRSKWKSDYLFAVLFIDIDRFKVVNDSLGHLAGDKLLIEIAYRLEECIRPIDNISRVAGNNRVSRFGGDEFAIFLNDIKDISSASRVADRIQKALQKPFNLDGHELYTSASIGIALSVLGYENAEDILRDADSAMYRAKATGKARAEIFDHEMHVRVTKILKLESDLRIAVEEEQFMVYYQPIVSATDSRITAAEALIRWKHPQQGFILPKDFIPIAEEIGLISKIGEWVLKTACAQNKAWQDAGYKHFPMKVNFSSRQFKDKNLIEMITKVIGETGMSAPFLDVEITESIAMEKSSVLILNQMTAMGLQASIDDFGTGYSSLGYLTRFPINTIKIDRTFIKNVAIDVNAQAIIRTIIAMAHSLKTEVVAEGVETEDQLAFLQSEKCDKIQGYLFSRPLPAEEFGKLLEQDKLGTFPINKHSASKV